MNNKHSIITELRKFVNQEWEFYIRDLAFEKDVNPSLSLFGETLVKKLMSLYRILSQYEKSLLDDFSSACIQNLREIDKISANKDILWSFIFVIREVKPVKERAEIALIIKEESLISLQRGNANLHELLIKAFIFIENSKDPILKEWILNLKKVDYQIYLRIYYFSHIGLKTIAIKEIVSIISGETKVTKTNFNISYNILIDVTSKYIDFGDIIHYLHYKFISINRNELLSKLHIELISYWKANVQKDILPLILHIEDYFNQSEKNGNSNSKFMEDLLTLKVTIEELIITYYKDDRQYNHPRSDTKEQFKNQILKSM